MDFKVDRKKLQEILSAPDMAPVPDAPRDDAQSGGQYEFKVDREKLKSIIGDQQPEGVLDTVGSWVSGVAQSVKEAFTGPPNLQFKDAGDIMDFLNKQSFTDPKAHQLSNAILMAKYMAQGDKPYADIIEKRFREIYPDKFVKRVNDNGYDVFLVREGDKVVPYYVNRPGIDTQDIQRLLAIGSIYGGVGGMIGRGLSTARAGLAASAGAFGTGEAATSVALDTAANVAGADVSAKEMALNAALALGGGMAGQAAERAISKFGAWLRAKNYVAGDKLSEAGVKRLKDLGLSDQEIADIQSGIERGFIKPQELANDATRPQIVTEPVMNEAGQIATDESGNIVRQTGPLALKRKYAAKSVGIDLTTGEATKNPDIINMENAYAAGDLGLQAQEKMRTKIGRYGDASVQAERMNQGVDRSLYQDVGAEKTTRVDTGAKIQDTLKSEYNQRMDVLNNDMESIPDVVPQKFGVGMVTNYVDEFSKKYGGLSVIDQVKRQLNNPGLNLGMDNAAEALRVLQKFERRKLAGETPAAIAGFVKKKPKKKTNVGPPSFWGIAKDIVKREESKKVDIAGELLKRSRIGIRSVRKSLMILRDKAYSSKNMDDYAATAKILNAFDSWVADYADRFSADELKDYMHNMSLRARVKEKFFGKGNDPGGKWIRDLIENDRFTPETIISDLTNKNRYSIARVRALKRALGENSNEIRLLKGLMLADIFEKASGNKRTMEEVFRELRKLQQNKAVFRELFTKRDRKKISEFMMKARALDRMPPGDKKTGNAFTKWMDDVTQFILHKQGTRETFHGKSFRGSLYHAAARWLANKNIIGAASRSKHGRIAAGFAEGKLPQHLPRTGIGPAAGAIAAQQYGQAPAGQVYDYLNKENR